LAGKASREGHPGAAAEKGCPVSKLFKAEITLTKTLK
jgi:hypothetical protein